MIDFKSLSPVLTFFSHPDDETLAAGATIKKMTNMGIEVVAAIPATGIFSRKEINSIAKGNEELLKLRKDCVKALGILGIKHDNIFLGDFSDNEMDKHSLLELIHWLEKIILKVKPGLVLTHHRFCTNIDHQYCHNAAVVATRPGINNHISLLTGEVPSSTGYLKPTMWEPNYYVEVNEGEVNSKISALEAYEGEIRKDPHPRSKEVLKALAKLRGSESGFEYAEAFMVNKCFG